MPWRRWDHWRICWPRARWWVSWPGADALNRDRLRGSHRPRRTSMQPVQLSLIPDPHPRPATLVEQLPPEAVAAAVTLLARVIAKASVVAGIEVIVNE